jgi:sugar phosphate isomerase/epimerase
MSQNRRSFLRSLAGMAGAIAAGDASACARQRRPQVLAGAVAATIADSLGVQLYTVREEMQRDMPSTLARVAEIGYREVEFAGYFGRSPAEIRDLLERNQLRAPSTHVGYGELNKDWQALLQNAAQIGHEFVTIPSLPDTERASIAGLKRIAAAFNRGGAEAKSAGLRLAFHNHNIEFAPVEGMVPLEVLLQETDPGLVTFELDVFWAFHAGRDPVALLQAHPRRFTMLHLKDSAGPPEHRMVDVGAGVIDFRAILAQSKAAGLLHFFVEHDRPADAIASIRNSFSYLSSLKR